MSIIIERGKTVKLEDLSDWSIALDGFVQGPGIDSEHHRYSFDHHNKCLRFATLATCAQIYHALNLGFEYDPELYTIYANDADTDVCLSVWLLQNKDRIHDPLVKKLVDAVSILDMHAGAFPVNGMGKTVEWVSAPETDSKRTGDYAKLSDSGLYSVMEAVMHRIDVYVNGEASAEINKQCKHGEYKIINNADNFIVIESQDPHITSSLYQAGFDRLVVTRKLPDSLAVTLAKRSDFIDHFPLFKMYEEFNKLEPGWNGSSSIGGAPRNPDGSRSKLPLETIIRVVDECCKA